MFCSCPPTEFDPDFFAAGRLIGKPATSNESKTETKFLHTGHSGVQMFTYRVNQIWRVSGHLANVLQTPPPPPDVLCDH